MQRVPARNERTFLPGCIASVVILLVAIGLTLATLKYQRPSDPFCGGRLSAGFPLAVVCDASGESPLSSVGKIDAADWDSMNLLGIFLDILIYALLLRILWLGILVILRR